MKKMFAIWMALCLCLGSSIVMAEEIPNRIPTDLYISEHWLSLTTSYDIESKTQKIGTLYRRFFSLLLTYDFYDTNDNEIAYARSRFFSLTAHFDVYDNNEMYLGAADEKLFAFFPTFDIYANDGYTKLATASMNFWGTTFYIYDPLTRKEMAYMSRSFFRLKNNWTFHITNRSLFDHKGIDPRVLMTVIAFQGDREYWESQEKNKKGLKALTTSQGSINPDISKQQIQSLLAKVNAVKTEENLDEVEDPSEETAMAIANELENAYAENTTQIQTAQERIDAFTDYCLNMIQSNQISKEKKKAIMFLLETRLEMADK